MVLREVDSSLGNRDPYVVADISPLVGVPLPLVGKASGWHHHHAGLMASRRGSNKGPVHQEPIKDGPVTDTARVGLSLRQIHQAGSAFIKPPSRGESDNVGCEGGVRGVESQPPRLADQCPVREV